MNKRKRTPVRPAPQNTNLAQRLWEQLKLTWALMLDNRVPTVYKIIPVVAIAYAISPLDLVPDIFIGLGWLDDLCLILLSISWFNSLAPADVAADHLRRFRRESRFRVRHEKDGMVIEVMPEREKSSADGASSTHTEAEPEEKDEAEDIEGAAEEPLIRRHSAGRTG